jgi:hypothetical protein
MLALVGEFILESGSTVISAPEVNIDGGFIIENGAKFVIE